MHSRRGLPLIFVGFESHSHVNASDHKDVILQLNLTDSFADQASTGRVDLTRLQRASKGSGQSTRGGGDNVIQGGGVRIEHVGRNLVMFRNRAVHSEDYGLLFGRQIRPADGTLDALDPHVRAVDHFRRRGLRHDCRW